MNGPVFGTERILPVQDTYEGEIRDWNKNSISLRKCPGIISVSAHGTGRILLMQGRRRGDAEPE